MNTLAIIIAAYDSSEYIMDCVKSVKNQLLTSRWTYDLRIGVDGCQKTAEILKKNKIRFYYSEKNVGAYVMRNSLIYLSRADAYSYFDADDVMKKNYLKFSVVNIEPHHACMTAKIQCDEKLKPRQGYPAKIESGGAITFTHRALELVGGFYRHRCACDTDFMHRLEMAGIHIHKINEGLYFRRLHNRSLTRGGLTVYGGKYRKQVWAEMCDNRKRGVIKIKPTIIKLEMIK